MATWHPSDAKYLGSFASVRSFRLKEDKGAALACMSTA
jgi:hypothetical protein